MCRIAQVRAIYGCASPAWSLARWPTVLSEQGDHRLFVAVNGAWRGCFKISGEALYNPDDARTPCTLLFDTKTWTPMTPVAVHRFRGFTYDVPRSDSQKSD